ncbi:MAG: thioesterase family protein [Acidobacteria bacterium]|nr:thioesterase family protein [Acidobacteriota bacterium]
MTTPYRHTIRVRYGEVDKQGVVFNAHYMAYMDDAMETWLLPIRELRNSLGWDMMLRRTTIDFLGSVTDGDLLDIDLAIRHWGRTSWILGYRGTHEGRPVFTGEVVYVSVKVPGYAKQETPPEIRAYMGPETDLNEVPV